MQDVMLTKFITAEGRAEGHGLSREELVLALYAAVGAGDVPTVRRLIESGADVNAVLQGENSLLGEVMQVKHMDSSSADEKQIQDTLAKLFWEAGARADVASCDAMQAPAARTHTYT